jgi:hypothetical protein
MRPPLLAALAAGLLAASALSGWLAYRGAVAELDRALELRPPLAVLDYETITARLAQGTPAKELEPAFAGLKRWSSRLREHGYLVLNRAAADAVPEAYLVRPDPADLPAPVATTPPPAIPPAAPLPSTGPSLAISPGEARALIDTLTTPGESQP